MYIFKNALRSITRAKGRNILIGIIVLVIAVSSCLALSIREAADKTKENTLNNMQITAQIAVDRSALFSSAKGDKESMTSALQGQSSLTLDQLQTYAKASSVKDFYYTLSTSLDAGDDIDPIDTAGTFSRDDSSSSSSSSKDDAASGGFGGGDFTPSKGFGGGKMGQQGDFTIIGYSSDAAMTSFVSGTSTITSGAVFSMDSTTPSCIINQTLANYNSLKVGSTITLKNPNKDTEAVTLTVVGIYKTAEETTDTTGGLGGFSTATDAGNRIYMSYPALKAITDASDKANTSSSDSSTTSTAIRHQLSGTYVFADKDAYESFTSEVRAMGLSDTYTVSSQDITRFEQSMQPLENLNKIATYFLIVVFAIGAVILIVLNIFSIRDRKYEIGVLTAIGMKKRKVALQFITELFVVTFAAVILGAAVGAATSVPVTNALLSSQVTAATESAGSVDSRFGRGADQAAGGNGPSMPGSSSDNVPQAPSGGFMNRVMGQTQNYISEVSYSTDLRVIGELIGVGALLTLISSLAAVTFIMRYEPLKILTNRD